MALHDALHLIATALSAIAVSVRIGSSQRQMSAGLLAAILMLMSMVDSAHLHLVAAVLWTPTLLGAAIALAAARSRRRRRRKGCGVYAATHDELGLVATAALLSLMNGGVGAGATAHAGHDMPGGLLLTGVVFAITGAYLIGAIVAGVRDAQGWGRSPYLLMGGATACMAAAAAAM